VSAGGARAGRLDRQSLIPSETLSGGGASGRVERREASLELGRSGNGPSRLHGLSNFALSSNPPPGPVRSLAKGEKFRQFSIIVDDVIRAYEVQQHLS
jgi:hypothetical protein